MVQLEDWCQTATGLTAALSPLNSQSSPWGQ